MFFYVVIILYNQFVKNCKIDWDAFEGVAVFIADNSTQKNILRNNNDFCSAYQIRYIEMNGNKGIPKAYNRVISEIPHESDSWIIVCDQDTEIPHDFLQKYKTAIAVNPNKKIFCPVIKDAVGIMSPSKIKGKKFVHSELCDFNNYLEDYSFINSCMCINAAVFKDMKYDENIFLDFADHDFVRAVRERYTHNIFHVVDSVQVYQNFSGVTKNPLQSDLTRFKIYLSDAYYYYEKWYGTKKTAFFILLVRAMKLSFFHKNAEFLKIVLSFRK